MFNLLPPNEKKILKKEYNARRAFVYVISVGALFVVSACLLVPLYVVYNNKLKSAEIQYDSLLHAQNNVKQSYADGIRHLNVLLTLLNAPEATSTLSIIGQVVAARPGGIVLSSISYSAGSPASIEIGGIAASRDSLYAFTNALGNVQGFSVGVLPVSEFVKDSDIPFSITITIAAGNKSS